MIFQKRFFDAQWAVKWILKGIFILHLHHPPWCPGFCWLIDSIDLLCDAVKIDTTEKRYFWDSCFLLRHPNSFCLFCHFRSERRRENWRQIKHLRDENDLWVFEIHFICLFRAVEEAEIFVCLLFLHYQHHLQPPFSHIHLNFLMLSQNLVNCAFLQVCGLQTFFFRFAITFHSIRNFSFNIFRFSLCKKLKLVQENISKYLHRLN